MNFKTAINTILDIAKENKIVQEIGYGDIYEYLNSGEHKYPCVFLTVDNVATNQSIGSNTINCTLFYVDRLLDNDSNKIDIQSYAITVLEGLVNKLENIFLEITTTNITLFTQQFADLTAGGYLTATITYQSQNIC